MEFTIKPTEIENAVLATSESTNPSFRIKTIRPVFSTHMTYIYAISPQSQEERKIGEIAWAGFPAEIITCNDVKMNRVDYMRSKQRSVIRVWTAGDRKEYQWTFRDPIELFTLDTPPKKIAYYAPGSLLRLKKPKFVVTEDAVGILESVIVAFAFLQISLQNAVQATPSSKNTVQHN